MPPLSTEFSQPTTALATENDGPAATPARPTPGELERIDYLFRHAGDGQGAQALKQAIIRFCRRQEEE